MLSHNFFIKPARFGKINFATRFPKKKREREREKLCSEGSVITIYLAALYVYYGP